MNNERNEAIQSLRGFAALLVVFTHTIINFVEKTGADASSLTNSYQLGELGVRIFFVISGFIMTETMYESFAKPGSASTFIWKRLVRIVPLYWLATLIYVTKLAVTGELPQAAEVFMSLLFFPYDHGQPLYAPVYSAGWTLNYEMFFYFLFMGALFLTRRTGLLTLLCTLLVLVLLGQAHLVHNCTKNICTIERYFTSPIILYFAAGILLATARMRLKHRNKLPSIGTGLATAISLILVCTYGIYVHTGLSVNDSIESIAIQILACGMITAVCALAKASEGINPLRSLLLSIGDSSYSIYLTHIFLIGAVGRLWDITIGPHWLVIYVVAMILGSSYLGFLSYRYVEKPMLRLLRKRMTRKQASAEYAKPRK